MSDWYEPADDYAAVDAALRLPGDAALERLVDDIEAEHRTQEDATAAWRKRENRRTSLLGQRHCARLFRLPMDTRVLKYGTKHAPFTLGDGTRVAPVTRTPVPSKAHPDLTVPYPYRTNADVWVLIVWHGDRFEPEVLGWATREDLADGTVGHFRDGLENRVLAAGRLRPFWALLARHRPEDPLAQPPPESLGWTPPVAAPVVDQLGLWR